MTLDEVKKNVRVETGSGALEPEAGYVQRQKTASLFPDLTMKKTVRQDLNRERHSALLYPEEFILQIIRMIPIRQSYRSTRKQVEVVGFSDDMTYVLWNEVDGVSAGSICG